MNALHRAKLIWAKPIGAGLRSSELLVVVLKERSPFGV
jgi:hypothetical protein